MEVGRGKEGRGGEGRGGGVEYNSSRIRLLASGSIGRCMEWGWWGWRGKLGGNSGLGNKEGGWVREMRDELGSAEGSFFDDSMGYCWLNRLLDGQCERWLTVRGLEFAFAVCTW